MSKQNFSTTEDHRRPQGLMAGNLKSEIFCNPRVVGVPCGYRDYFFSVISTVARVFSQSIYIWQPLPIS